MNFISRHITQLAVLVISLIGLAGCVNSQIEEVETPSVSREPGEESPRITLAITPLSQTRASAGVKEMIHSLRIIMLNETTIEDEKVKYVEINEYIDLTNHEHYPGAKDELANESFRYVFTRATVAGKKKFYLIANEEKVIDIKFQLGSNLTLPDGINDGMTLTNFLNSFTPDYIPEFDYTDDAPEEKEPTGEQFESLINSLYYTPDFSEEIIEADAAGNVIDSKIYLPYTSHYEFDLYTQSDIDSGNAPANATPNVIEQTLYLVPNATKFKFEFQNYRPDYGVEISKMRISGIASDMYLFPQLKDDEGNLVTTELYKTYNSKSYWWIDWLSKISEASKNVTDPTQNGTMNSGYGWISTYQLPATAYPKSTEWLYNKELRPGIYEEELRPGTFDIVSIMKKENIFVPMLQEGDPVTGVPGTTSTGYFYFPESRNLVDQDIYDDSGKYVNTIKVQRYFLNLEMKSVEQGSQTVIKDTPIGNLGSMFRDTNTLITITLRDSRDVGAYAQLENWGVSHTNGNVIEDNTPYDE